MKLSRCVSVVAAGCSIGLCSLEALAQNLAKAEASKKEDVIENVLVTGAKISGAQVAQSTVLDADDIQLLNSASSVDLLRNSVGIDVVQPGGPGGVTELFIRGAESNFTVVTVDGVRMNDTTNSRGGGFDLSTINPDEIERVEILRGPLSAIYGSDALAGAINIKTRDPRDAAAFSGRAEGGSEGFQRAYAAVTAGKKNTDGSSPVASLSAAYLDAGEPVPGSTSTTRSVAAKVDWMRTQTRELDFSLRSVKRSRSGYPSASGGYDFAVSDDLETSEASDLSASAHWRERVSQAITVDIRTTHFKRDEQIDTPAVDGGVLGAPLPAAQSDSELTRNKMEGFVVWDVQRNTAHPIKAVLGASAETESGKNNTVYDYGFPLEGEFDLSRDTHALFAEFSYQPISGVDVFASTRWDKAETVDAQLSSKFAVRYPIAEATIVGASWGEAFKLPSFYAVGDSLVGNPDLAPETSDTLELMLEQFLLAGKVKVTGALFQSSYENLIDFDFETFKMVNVESVDVSGAEGEVLVRVQPNLEVGVHSTYTHYDVHAGEDLDGRPNWRGGLFSEWHFADWSARAHWAATGKRTSTSTATGKVNLDAYHRLDIAIGKRLNSNVTLSVNMDNVLDKKYYDEVGFPSAGVSGRVGLSIRY